MARRNGEQNLSVHCWFQSFWFIIVLENKYKHKESRTKITFYAAEIMPIFGKLLLVCKCNNEVCRVIRKARGRRCRNKSVTYVSVKSNTSHNVQAKYLSSQSRSINYLFILSSPLKFEAAATAINMSVRNCTGDYKQNEKNVMC